MNYAEESLRLHGEWKGKIEVVSRVQVKTREDLSLAYGEPVPIPKDPVREESRFAGWTYGDDLFDFKTPVESDMTLVAWWHRMTRVEATEPTCTEPGNSEYWSSEAAGWYSSDSLGQNEIDMDSWVIPAGHKLTKTEAADATCTEEGNSAYWTCSVC